MVPGIEPKEALNRLRMFSDEYSVRKRKYDSYFSGEALFGLPHQSYPALEETTLRQTKERCGGRFCQQASVWVGPKTNDNTYKLHFKVETGKLINGYSITVVLPKKGT